MTRCSKQISLFIFVNNEHCPINVHFSIIQTICMCTFMYICAQSCTYICAHSCTHVHINVHMCTFMYTCAHSCTYVHIHVHTYVHIHVHTYVRTFRFMKNKMKRGKMPSVDQKYVIGRVTR
jgi:hypothetical protein